jgi:hypothetical protein
MNTYKIPQVEVLQVQGLGRLMDPSPNGNIQGNPGGGTNNPGGFGGGNAPKHRPF